MKRADFQPALRIQCTTSVRRGCSCFVLLTVASLFLRAHPAIPSTPGNESAQIKREIIACAAQFRICSEASTSLTVPYDRDSSARITFDARLKVKTGITRTASSHLNLLSGSASSAEVSHPE
jgi:hypothetical protein